MPEMNDSRAVIIWSLFSFTFVALALVVLEAMR
jgi:hypothetical protein